MTHSIEERHDALQLRMSWGAVIGSGGLALQEVSSALNVTGWPHLVIVLLSLAGWAVFGVNILRIHRLGKTAEGRAYFQAATRDEVVAQARNQAFVFGFAAMLFLQVVLLLLGGFLGTTGFNSLSVGASLTIAVAVAASTLRYLSLSKA